MSRFKTATGVIVSVADEDDHYLRGTHYRKAQAGRSRQSDDPTPTGPTRRQQQPAAEETLTGQIRRQQAADPFGSR